MMEPKTRNEGHGYFSIKSWSYMDQRWKHWYGTNRIEHFVKKQVDYWPLYVNHFISRLSNLEGLLVEETTNNDKHIILTCSFVGDRPFQVVLKKRNLLKMKKSSLLLLRMNHHSLLLNQQQQMKMMML